MLITSSTIEATSKRDGRAERNVVGDVRRQVDAADHDERERRHAQLGDGWQAALVHPDAILVMITSVAICMIPRIPAQ